MKKSPFSSWGNILINAGIAKLAVEQNQQYLKIKFQNIISVSDAVHDLDQAKTHVVAIYLKDNNTSGIPKKLKVKMPDGNIKTISTEIIKGVGVGSIHISQKDKILSVDALSVGSVCCAVDTNKGFKAVVTAGHIFSDGNSTNSGGELDASMQTAAYINDQKAGTWFFQIINYKNDVALAKIDNWIADADYISFKEYYQVSDIDVKKKQIKLVSNKSGERMGYILDHNVSMDVQYDDKTIAVNNIILVGKNNDRNASESVSQKGDSGGCVYEPVSGKLIGLILGGDYKFTWVLPLKETFEQFNYKLI